MIDPLFLIEEGLRIENLVLLAAIVIAVDLTIPQERPMNLNVPTNKAEAREALKKLLDELDGVPDSVFDAKAFGKRMAGAFADDWKENLIVAGFAIVIWELGHVAFRVFF